MLVGLIVLVEARGNEQVRHAMVEDIVALGAETADRPAPQWSLMATDGQKVSLEDLKDKVVFLNFWASWCQPCVEEMPSMERLSRKYEGRDLVMVAISQDDSMEAIGAFLQKRDQEGKPIFPRGEVTMQILLDTSGTVSRTYGTQKLPETYIINRKGQIVARFVNKDDWDREEVDRFIERLLRQ